MKGDKGKLLSESDEKDNFDRKNYTKLLNVNEMKVMIGSTTKMTINFGRK